MVKSITSIYDFLDRKPPKRIVEVGAAAGVDTLRLFNQYHPEEIIAFEPMELNFQILENNCKPYPEIKCFKAAIGASTGREKFYSQTTMSRYQNYESSSLLPPTNHYQKFPEVQFQETEVDVLHIYDIVQRDKSYDLLWLDTQGAEYQILETIVNNFEVVYTEFQNDPLYMGQVPLYKITQLLSTKGYKLKKAFEYDAIYVNK
jgi:FkbM family methyltransferase